MNPSTWILLRGLAREKGHWGGFTEQFQAAFAQDEILAIDLPGVGEFRDRVSPSHMNEIFNFVRAKVIERTHTHTPIRVMALSLGGMVAMEWMRQKPQDLASVVLINTSLRSLSPFYHRLRWQVWVATLKLVAKQNPRDREKDIIDLLLNSEEARQKALPLWSKLAVEHPVSYRTFFNQLLAAARFEGLSQKPDVPVLLLNSLGDRFVDPSCSSDLQQAMGWPLERHAWAGHDLPWDDPAWVVQKTLVWTDFINA